MHVCSRDRRSSLFQLCHTPLEECVLCVYYTWSSAHTHIHTHYVVKCTYTWSSAHTHIHTHYVVKCTYTWSSAHTHIHTYTHTHIHTYTHTHTHYVVKCTYTWSSAHTYIHKHTPYTGTQTLTYHTHSHIIGPEGTQTLTLHTRTHISLDLRAHRRLRFTHTLTYHWT